MIIDTSVSSGTVLVDMVPTVSPIVPRYFKDEKGISVERIKTTTKRLFF